MKPTSSSVTRLAGLAAIAAGVLFVVVQIIHPVDALASVTTDAWVIVHGVSFSMCFFGILGLAGLYSRQIDKAGWLGLIGYVLFSLFYLVTGSFQFIEALISPVLATAKPEFVESFLGIITGHAGSIPLDTLSSIYKVTGGLYILGSLLFGIATFRARILPRWAAVLLAVSGPLAALVTSVFSHPIDRLAALPMGLALAGLGLALLIERRERTTQSFVEHVGTTVGQAGA